MFLGIRTYRLKSGTGKDFARVMREQSVPLLKEFGITLVAFGLSLVDEDSHEEAYLIRAFPTLEAGRLQGRVDRVAGVFIVE